MCASKNDKVSQKIIEYIQDLILEDKLKTGDKLPSERQLGEQFQIGRPAIREALSALEVIGLVEMRHGQGNFVANNTASNYLKALSISFKLDNGSNSDIMELRTLVEPFTAKVAAQKADSSQVARLYELHQAMIAAETPLEKSECDQTLHLEIAKISENKLILALFLNVSYLFDMYTRRTVAISILESKTEEIYEEHSRIIKAIESHDPDAAERHMVTHLSNIENL